MPALRDLSSDVRFKIGDGVRRLALRIHGKTSVWTGKVRPGFFDAHPRFLETSETTATRNRLNERHRACIEWNRDILRGKTVLDIASHDGRWSFAALKAGAAHVLGIEAREHLVKSAGDTLAGYGIDPQHFEFRQGDAFPALDAIEPGSIDTVMCLGFFYHVTDHMSLLLKIARLRPKHVILDTAVHPDIRPKLLLVEENFAFESDAAKTSTLQRKVLAGIPSARAVEMMLDSLGWSYEYYPWRSVGINRWDEIEDYHEGTRITLRATCG